MKISPLGGAGMGYPGPRAAPVKGAGDGGSSFAEAIKKAVDQVNRLQLEADEASRRVVSGDVADLHQVTIMAEKANLALELTIQVRNKVIEAYQEIMRMQV